MSTLKVNAIKNTSDVEMYLAKAWVNFNGTGTVTIRAGGNVLSITDNGIGDYTINFISALQDANYSAAVLAQRSATDSNLFGSVKQGTSPTTTALRLQFQTGSAASEDAPIVSVVVFR